MKIDFRLIFQREPTFNMLMIMSQSQTLPSSLYNTFESRKRRSFCLSFSFKLARYCLIYDLLRPPRLNDNIELFDASSLLVLEPTESCRRRSSVSYWGNTTENVSLTLSSRLNIFELMTPAVDYDM